ncbi:MAG: glycosyltransferase family 4 protein [Thiobacillus sp.]|nr:glycosyltransferase family 4 protein [Thiobacillus sp.]
MSPQASRHRLLLHAPNVHAGGGLVLLTQFLTVTPTAFLWAQLDQRAQDRLPNQPALSARYVRRSILSRLVAEWRLWRECKNDDLVLCFHGLPPLLPLQGRVVVFVQNRLLIERSTLAEYPSWLRLRLRLERLWFSLLQARCSHYIVQTPSMAAALRSWLRHEIPVSVAPFVPAPATSAAPEPHPSACAYDFLYVASGEAHKNHMILLEAWRQLADAGLRPSLAVTLGAEADPELCRRLEDYASRYGLAVTNLGCLAPEAVETAYRQSGAMIYPSLSESFGLPLVEAARHGLPILAPELDYVRDIVVPVETFDPKSPMSIARAVRRFLGAAEPAVQVGSAADFLAEVLR